MARGLMNIPDEFLVKIVELLSTNTQSGRAYYDGPARGRSYPSTPSPLVAWLDPLLTNDNPNWKDPLKAISYAAGGSRLLHAANITARKTQRLGASWGQTYSTLSLEYVPEVYFIVLLVILRDMTHVSLVRQESMSAISYAWYIGDALGSFMMDEILGEHVFSKLQSIEFDFGPGFLHKQISPLGDTLSLPGLRSLHLLGDDGGWKDDVCRLGPLGLVNVSLVRSNSNSTDLLTELRLFTSCGVYWTGNVADLDEEPFQPLRCLPLLRRLKVLSIELRNFIDHPGQMGGQVLGDFLPPSLEKLDIVFHWADKAYLKFLEPLFIGALAARHRGLPNLQKITVWRLRGSRKCHRDIVKIYTRTSETVQMSLRG
ncbi:hypothetical protein F4779DRAFT_614995 [Xylariaceae sp. FL0662B]|nr:hypothetical protein F4779DRAFT_614995 [Xylariaceae sp. FL0662B]